MGNCTVQLYATWWLVTELCPIPRVVTYRGTDFAPRPCRSPTKTSLPINMQYPLFLIPYVCNIVLFIFKQQSIHFCSLFRFICKKKKPFPITVLQLSVLACNVMQNFVAQLVVCGGQSYPGQDAGGYPGRFLPDCPAFRELAFEGCESPFGELVG